MKDKKEPKIGKNYYWIGNGHILKGVHKEVWRGSDVDKARFKTENFFTSKKEADWMYKMFNGNF